MRRFQARSRRQRTRGTCLRWRLGFSRRRRDRARRRRLRARDAASGSRRSRSRSPPRSPLDLLDLEATTGIWPDDVRVRHLLSHTSGYDGECGDLARFGFGDDALGRAVAELPEAPAVRRRRARCGRTRTAATGSRRTWRPSARASRTRTRSPRGCSSRPASSRPRSASRSSPAPAPTRRTSATRARAGPRAGSSPNVPDLLRFGRWHLSRPESARLRVPLGKPIGGVYGLGLFGERVGGVEVWGHVGSYGGFQSSLLVVPDRDAVFAGLTNSSHGEQALRELEDVFFERVLGARRAFRRRSSCPARCSSRSPAPTRRATSGWRSRCAESGLVVGFEGSTFATRAIGPGASSRSPRASTRRTRFDFPLEGFGRFGASSLERVA